MNDRLPSASGARISGDDYQHALTWLEALRLLQGTDVTKIEFEVGDAEAGVVDDLVVHRTADMPSLYKQIKFSVDDTTPLSAEWFTTPPRSGARTPLKRFYESFRMLAAEGRPLPDLELITSRQVAPDDPFLKHRSGRDSRLTPRRAAWDASAEEVFELWRAHLDITDGELSEFLEHLKVTTNRGSLEQLLEHCGDRMRAAGLRDDEDSVAVGVGIIRALIGEGTRELDPAALRAIVEQKEMATEPPCATLLVQELDHRAHPELATASVDWADDFIGDSRDERRAPKDDDAWNDIFLPDLRRAAGEILDLGHNLVRLDGYCRLSTAFMVGRELNERSNVNLVVPLGGSDWSSEEPPEEVELEIDQFEIADRPGVALAVAVSNDIAADVESYLREGESPRAGRLVVIRPGSGPDRHSVAGPGAARAIAEEVVDQARAAIPKSDEEVHLFLSCPRPLAVFLGRVWNRAPGGWVYADLDPGYGRSYRI